MTNYPPGKKYAREIIDIDVVPHKKTTTNTNTKTVVVMLFPALSRRVQAADE